MLRRDYPRMTYFSIVSLTHDALPPIEHTGNWAIEYNPLVYNFEDWSILNDLEFGFMSSALPSVSGPLELPESPLSSSSLTSEEDLFGEMGIDPNVLSRHLYDEPAATC